MRRVQVPSMLRRRPGRSDRPQRLSALPLFELGEGESWRGARVLTRLDPFEREVEAVTIHGDHELQKADGVLVPASYVARLPDALVAGRNSGVVCGRRFVVPGPDHVFELGPQLFAEFLEGDGERRTLRDNPTLRADRRHARGALVTSRFTNNYFHFVVDALQAACLADRVVDDGVPLVVDGRVPRQGRELLERIAPQREVLAVPPGEFWRFDELLLAVSGSYAPDVPELAKSSTYDTRLLGEVRARAFDGIAPAGATDELLYVSRRRYLEANAGRAFVQMRDVVNSLELEEHVEALGGRVVFPEELSGPEQVKRFRSARVVAAPTGSAVANAVFCAPGTTWITLHQNRLVNPWYFSNMARDLGLRWRFAVGEPAAAGAGHPLHANFEVSVATLHAAIEAAANATGRPIGAPTRNGP